MLYLGYIMLRFAVLIYSPEVAFNIHLTFLHENVIKMFTVQQKLYFLTSGYFLRAPDNSIRFRRFQSWIFLCPVSHNA